jgi:hypothetical protein
VAEELGRVAQKRDSPEVINFFMHLDKGPYFHPLIASCTP